MELTVVRDPATVEKARPLLEEAVVTTGEVYRMFESFVEKVSSRCLYLLAVVRVFFYPWGPVMVYASHGQVENVEKMLEQDNVKKMLVDTSECAEREVTGSFILLGSGHLQRLSGMFVVADFSGELVRALSVECGGMVAMVIPYGLADLLPHPFTGTPTFVVHGERPLYTSLALGLVLEAWRAFMDVRGSWYCHVLDYLLHGRGNSIDEVEYSLAIDIAQRMPVQAWAQAGFVNAVFSQGQAQSPRQYLEEQPGRCWNLPSPFRYLCKVLTCMFGDVE